MHPIHFEIQREGPVSKSGEAAVVVQHAKIGGRSGLRQIGVRWWLGRCRVGRYER